MVQYGLLCNNYDDNIAMFAKNTFKSIDCSGNKQLLCHPQSSVAKEYN